jgi:hypothetical protein
MPDNYMMRLIGMVDSKLKDHLTFYHSDDAEDTARLRFTYLGEEYYLDEVGTLRFVINKLALTEATQRKCKQQSALRGCL